MSIDNIGMPAAVVISTLAACLTWMIVTLLNGIRK